MNGQNGNDKLVFSVTVEEVQEEAMSLIGRELSDDELPIASDYINSGLYASQFIVFAAAIREAISANKKSA